MAWRKAKTVTGLKLKIHGASIELGDFTGFPLVFSDELLQVASDPWGKAFNYNGLNHNTNYDIIAGAGFGSTDLRSYFYSLNTNESMYIYNDTFGESVNIEFMRTGSLSGTTYVNYYGQRSAGTSMKVSIQTPEAGYIAWMSFALFVDDENGLGTVVTCGNATYYMSGLGERADRYEQAGFGSNASPLTHVVYMLVAGHEIDPPQPTTDPYADGGYSTQDGGGGDFDDSSDVIALPSTPALNLSLNHFISAYVPSINDINDLADWIWGNYDKFDSTKVLGKFFTEPMESILSLHMLPFTPASSTAIAVTIGNFATGLTMKPMTLQFTDIDCGSLSFTEFWGNYLDYNPYTKIVLCLPFVGQVDLDADEVMGKSVSVKYRVDNLTGAFVCFVYIDSDKILGQYSGECMLQVPVTAGSYASMNAAIATIACTAAASFGGATAAAIGGGYGGMIGVEKGLQMGGQALGETLASGASNVNGMKLQVSHSGALTGTAGFLGVMKPYAIIHRPRQCVPEHYNELAGYPSNITKTLGDCSGFTSVRTMIYDGLPFTDGEILALDSILKGGIFI